MAPVSRNDLRGGELKKEINMAGRLNKEEFVNWMEKLKAAVWDRRQPSQH